MESNQTFTFTLNAEQMREMEAICKLYKVKTIEAAIVQSLGLSALAAEIYGNKGKLGILDPNNKILEILTYDDMI